MRASWLVLGALTIAITPAGADEARTASLPGCEAPGATDLVMSARLPKGGCAAPQPVPQVPGLAGCSLQSTACPTWVSEPFDHAHGADAAVGDLVAVAPDGGTIYMGHTSGSAGLLVNAYDAADGALLWSSHCCNTNGTGFTLPDSLDVSADGSVVFLSAWIQPVEEQRRCTGVLAAYDTGTGEMLWSQPQRRREACWLPIGMVPYGDGVAVGKVVVGTDGTRRSIVERVSRDGNRVTIWRTRKRALDARRLEHVQDLGVSPDGRSLYVLDSRGRRDPATDSYGLTHWGVTSLDALGAPPVREWRYSRSFDLYQSNPLAGVVATRNRVVVTGSFLRPFRAFTLALDARTGKAEWERVVDTSQPWPHRPLATDGDSLFLGIGNWDSNPSLDGTNDVLAYDLGTGDLLWRDSFRSTTQDTATSYEFDSYPLVFADPAAGAVYEVVRGYGHIEVRALTAATGAVRWYSDYLAGERSASTDAEVAPGGDALFLGGSAVTGGDTGVDTIVLRYDDLVP